MDYSDVESPQPPSSVEPRTRRWQLARLTFMAVVAYLIAAYILLPVCWKFYERRHPSLDDVPGITTTGSGIPGDPLNVGLIATEVELQAIMAAAHWSSADSLSLRSDVRIAEDTVLDKSYDKAPVSSLYLFGARKTLLSRCRSATIRGSVITCGSGSPTRATRTVARCGWVPRLTTSESV